MREYCMDTRLVLAHLDNIQVKVVCPKCGFNWWNDLGELRGHYWKIHCTCEYIIQVKPIEEIYFHANGKRRKVWGNKRPKRSRKEKTVKQEGVNSLKIDYSSVVDGLVVLGYQRLEAKRVVSDFVNANNFTGPEDELMTQIVQGLPT
jgi:hypothetical protein